MLAALQSHSNRSGIFPIFASFPWTDGPRAIDRPRALRVSGTPYLIFRS